MSIQEHLNKIRNAIYGREVRESIAKGIETAYDDASEYGNANMEVKIARGTHPNLRSRLEEVDDKQQQTTAQLAQVDSKQQQTAAQLAQADREARRKREPEDLSERTLGLITGEGGAISLESTPQDYSVLPTKTTFARGGGGVNLWDGSFHYLALSGNDPFSVIETDNKQGIIVKVNPDTTYIMSKEIPPSGEENYFRVGFFNEKPVVGSTPTRRLTEGSNLPYQRTFTTESNEFYVLIQTAGGSSGTPPKWFQLEEGEQVSSYVDPNERILIDLDLNSHNKIIDKSKVNLWDSKFYKLTLSGNEPFRVIESEVAQGVIAKLKPNTTYSISKSQPIGGEQNFFITGLFTEKPIVGSTPTRRVTEGYNFPYERTFTTSDTESYALVQTAGANYGTPPKWFQIEENDEVTSYEPPYVIKEEMLPKEFVEKTNQGVENQKKFYFAEDLVGVYQSEESVNELHPVNSTHNQVLELYDTKIMSENSSYVTKEILGTVNNNEIPAYFFTPTRLSSSVYVERPKLIVVSGVHGNEKNTVYSTYDVMNKISNGWRENKILEFLRFNVDFIVIPVANPGGFDAHTRENGNGINLNSNFPRNKESSLDEREEETRIIGGFLNEHSDADLLIDFHRMYFRDGYFTYGIVNNEPIEKIYNQTIHMLGREYQKRYEFFPQEEDHEFGYTQDGLAGSLAYYSELVVGIPSIIVEMAETIGWRAESSQYDNFTVARGSEVLVNTLKIMIKELYS